MNEAIMKRVRNVIVDTGNLNTSEMLRRNLSKKSSEEASMKIKMKILIKFKFLICFSLLDLFKVNRR